MRPAWHQRVHEAVSARYSGKILGYFPLAYWPMWEPSGSTSHELINGWDGAYTGVTLGQTGIGDGRTCPWFDGANDYNNIWTAALAAAFDGGEGTVAIWGRVNGSGVWTDGTNRQFIQLYADASNWLFIRRSSVDNRLYYYYEAGGVAENVYLDSITTLDWMHLALTWSASAGANGEVKAYYNGAQTGVTQVGLGAWAGAPVTRYTNVGCNDNNAPSQVFHGWLAHAAVWDSALSSAAIADLATV